MLYAKVAVGLPVEGPFDYIIPDELTKKIKAGSRVKIDFRNKKITAYVVGLARKTNIKNLKTLLDLIDDSPVLNKSMLSLTRRLSEYYCCSWGEAIETALPLALRKGKTIKGLPLNGGCSRLKVKSECKPSITLIQDLNLDSRARWEIYLKEIKEALSRQESVIVLLPDVDSALEAKGNISAALGVSPGILYRGEDKELEEWLKAKSDKANIIVGTRSAVFAPVNNLGLIIIDAEDNFAYKQDQVPHYHAREVAFMRADLENARVILGSTSPSLESIYLAKKNKIKYTLILRRTDFPQINVIDTKRGYHNRKQKDIILSKYLQDAVYSCLNAQGKALLFLNRRGFATTASCLNCNTVLKCPRCNINLVYYFQGNVLICHYCNFKIPAPNICPNCNSGYIRYSGAGTEKVESELHLLFPQAKIKRIDNQKDLDIDAADIFISTQNILKGINYDFNLIGVLAIDNSLNHIDFRSAEAAFRLLLGLLGLATKKIIVQTSLSHHHCFQALLNKDIDMFYRQELKERKQLNFPPYRHIGLIKLRARQEARVKEAANALFNKLAGYNEKGIEVIAVSPAPQAKLRGNFYWQILVKAKDALKLSAFLKMRLKKFRHSGIIVTVDIDPL